MAGARGRSGGHIRSGPWKADAPASLRDRTADVTAPDDLTPAALAYWTCYAPLLRRRDPLDVKRARHAQELLRGARPARPLAGRDRDGAARARRDDCRRRRARAGRAEGASAGLPTPGGPPGVPPAQHRSLPESGRGRPDAFTAARDARADQVGAADCAARWDTRPPCHPPRRVTPWRRTSRQLSTATGRPIRNGSRR